MNILILLNFHLL